MMSLNDRPFAWLDVLRPEERLAVMGKVALQQMNFRAEAEKRRAEAERRFKSLEDTTLTALLEFSAAAGELANALDAALMGHREWRMIVSTVRDALRQVAIPKANA